MGTDERKHQQGKTGAKTSRELIEISYIQANTRRVWNNILDNNFSVPHYNFDRKANKSNEKTASTCRCFR